MALIGKECLNCGKKLEDQKREITANICKSCAKAINICPVCKGDVKGIIQDNFNYFVSCECGYYGRPTGNTQTGHPFDRTFENRFPSWNRAMSPLKVKKLDKTESELQYYKLRCEYQLRAMELCCSDNEIIDKVLKNILPENDTEYDTNGKLYYIQQIKKALQIKGD